MARRAGGRVPLLMRGTAMTTRWLIAGVAVWLLMAGPAEAGMQRLVLRVDGLACPFCAYGLEKKLLALPGVTSYDADLREGKVFVGLNASASLPAFERVRDMVKKAGFTLRSVSLTATGTLSRTAEGWVLAPNDSSRLLLYEIRTGQEPDDGDRPPPALSEALTARLTTWERQRIVVEVTGTLHTHEDRLPAMALEDIHPAKE